MHFGIHIKPIDKKSDSYYHYSAIQKCISPVRQSIVHKPRYGDEKHRDKTDPQQAENKNYKYFIVHIENPLNPPCEGKSAIKVNCYFLSTELLAVISTPSGLYQFYSRYENICFNKFLF